MIFDADNLTDTKVHLHKRLKLKICDTFNVFFHFLSSFLFPTLHAMDGICFGALLNEVLLGSQDLFQIQALEQRLGRFNGPCQRGVPVHRFLPCHGGYIVIVAKRGPQSLCTGGQEGLGRDGQETSNPPTERQRSEALISPFLRLLEMLPWGGVLQDLVAVLGDGHDRSKRFFVPMSLER